MLRLSLTRGLWKLSLVACQFHVELVYQTLQANVFARTAQDEVRAPAQEHLVQVHGMLNPLEHDGRT